MRKENDRRSLPCMGQMRLSSFPRSALSACRGGKGKLVAFFGKSPLVGVDLDLSRRSENGRKIDL
jgi:hypothetical protein